jgi:hypothetical protein
MLSEESEVCLDILLEDRNPNQYFAFLVLFLGPEPHLHHCRRRTLALWHPEKVDRMMGGSEVEFRTPRGRENAMPREASLKSVASICGFDVQSSRVNP